MAAFRAVLLSAVVCLALLASDRNAAALVPAPKPFAGGRGLVLDAVAECGVFDGKFQCRPATGGKLFGKGGSIGGEAPGGGSSTWSAPSGIWPGGNNGQAPQAMPADPNACQGGMVGTPPNCQCPENSELLGGNCVHYTASTCSKGLAANALPQACANVEEKTSCKLRDDGLKDCCCVTYNKF
ncbi:MAG: hypothetical protein AB7V40_01735 [Methyloceanibacter sp.]